MKLNLGAGQDALEDWINVDAAPVPGVNVVWDLDVGPWPWPDESVTAIRAFDIFEHVNDPLLFMNEAWRVLVRDGRLLLHTSYWKSMNSYTDPTHKRFCTEMTWDYWIPGTQYHARYGAAYSGGRHFAKAAIAVDGQELSVALIRGDRCGGSC